MLMNVVFSSDVGLVLLKLGFSFLKAAPLSHVPYISGVWARDIANRQESSP